MVFPGGVTRRGSDPTETAGIRAPGGAPWCRRPCPCRALCELAGRRLPVLADVTGSHSTENRSHPQASTGRGGPWALLPPPHLPSSGGPSSHTRWVPRPGPHALSSPVPRSVFHCWLVSRVRSQDHLLRPPSQFAPFGKRLHIHLLLLCLLHDYLLRLVTFPCSFILSFINDRDEF